MPSFYYWFLSVRRTCITRSLILLRKSKIKRIEQENGKYTLQEPKSVTFNFSSQRNISKFISIFSRILKLYISLGNFTDDYLENSDMSASCAGGHPFESWNLTADKKCKQGTRLTTMLTHQEVSRCHTRSECSQESMKVRDPHWL